MFKARFELGKRRQRRQRRHLRQRRQRRQRRCRRLRWNEQSFPDGEESRREGKNPERRGEEEKTNLKRIRVWQRFTMKF